MENIKKNKKYLAIIPIFAFLVSILTFNVSADSSYVITSFDNQPIAQYPSSSILYDSTTGNGSTTTIASNNPDTYVFLVQSGLSYNVEYVVSDPTNVTIYWNNNVWGNNQSWSYDSTTNLYYKYSPGFETARLSNLTPLVYSISDGLSAVRNYLDGGGSSSTTSKLNYSLPPGNAAFIEVASDNTFTLNTKFNEMSGLFNGVFSKTSQTWGWSNTIIESGSYPLSGHSLIPWAKGDNQNLLGQSHFGYASSNSITGSGKYLVIYNPLYSYQEDSNSNFEHNFSIDINCTSVYSISIVSLKGNLASGIESSWTLTSTPDGTVYTDNGIDNDTGIPTFVDQNGDDAIPEYGGSNFVATQTESFKEWLNSVVGSFLSIFTAGENAIMTLVHSGQGFFSILTSLYAWLPQSVFSVLTSGIVLVITIGIIKVFL